MMQTYNYQMKRILGMILLAVLAILPAGAFGTYGSIDFNRLTNRDGLSNSQVCAILKDDHGYVWFGTQSGLDRFDGFRMKPYLYDDKNDQSIPNNSVDEIQQDADGNLWVHTSMGYCLYDYETEQFARKPELRLKSLGIDEAFTLSIPRTKRLIVSAFPRNMAWEPFPITR